MFKLNKKGFSFVELLVSLTLIGLFMISFVLVNGYIMRMYNTKKTVAKFNDMIEITYYELKYNSSYLRETSKSKVVYLNGSATNALIEEDIDGLFVKEAIDNEYFLINIDCDYDEFVNKVKIIFYSESKIKWEKVIYVPRD
ncbi:prepilin-type N-terminal cleavage/methylation domain-containing protein [Oceanirhabdus seepicola]|uniref:Prepilin-type N-terminal cleavage/methylation domain-containing protein n=1 Tax=Oceanirhabdus seepicola TaxID=2828781 RepID=A0A9J6PAL9_9CLOT|nr:prepilin-type N-terminal cleavage/methylation domain-containing protein [Oceanirhabdus seepicola]MCM1992729.1 prepilin-type N-terminal cleavage/methylation domain-containing protein [Oceanirhabdus seepicola]